ncbi:MAG: hypothetical protein Q4G68_07710 [Planctomycetia bacterium]|nr:hypothetical protein [Planctomycetia bacterium]
MSNPSRKSPLEMVHLYLAGSLSEEDAALFADMMDHNVEITRFFQQNVLMDHWLSELCNAAVEPWRPAGVKSIPPLSELTGHIAGTGSSTEPDWDELVRLQNSEKPLSQMTPEEVAAYRARMATPVIAPIQSADSDYDPFAVLRELEEEEEREQQALAAQRREPHRWTLSDLFFIACVIVAIALGIGIYKEYQWELQRKNHPFQLETIPDDFNAIARISELIDPVWQESTPHYKRGEGIDSAELALKSGSAKIEFNNGAVLLLEAPVQFTVKDRLNTFCTFGNVSATIPPAAVGFTVGTPHGTIIDRGTEFFLAVDQNQFKAETNKGLIDVTTSDQKTTKLTKGNGIQVDHAGEQRLFRPSVMRFTTLETFGARLGEYVARLRKEKAADDLILNADPNLLVRFDAENRTENIIPNSSKAGRNLASELNITGAAATEGRWHGTQAIRFSGTTGECSFRLDGSYSRLILTANVRFDNISSQENTICASRDFLKTPGSFSWQTCRTGELILFVTDRQGHANLYASKKFMSKRDNGIWYKLSVIADAEKKTISHFVNARLISTVPWDEAMPLLPGQCLLGNSPQENIQGEGNRFVGALDEFQILTGK